MAVNHIIAYGLQLLDDETVKVSVAHMENHGIWFGWPLNGKVSHIINTTNGVNSTYVHTQCLPPRLISGTF
jgi:hypothetical protein